MDKIFLILVFSLSLLFLAGCDSGGSDDSNNSFGAANFTGGTTPGTPGAVPNLPNPATASFIIEESETIIPFGATHVFTVEIQGISGFGSLLPATVAAPSAGTVTGLPVTVTFGPLSQVGTNTFRSLGVFSGPLAGPGGIIVPIFYVEGANVASFNQPFNVLDASGAGVPGGAGGGGGGAGGGGGGPGGTIPLLVCDSVATFVANSATTTSTITVAGGPTSIADLNVFINLRHETPSQLDISLTSPTGTIIGLSSSNGGSTAHVYSTVTLDDEAPGGASVTTISSSGGAFTPEMSLSSVDGEPSAGVWTLTIVDTADVDPGVLVAWCLAFDDAGISDPGGGTPVEFSSTVGAAFGGTAPSPASPASVSDSIAVAGGPTTIFDVRVRVDIDHVFSGLVAIDLTSPTGTSIALTPGDVTLTAAGYGGAVADVFSTVIFDDFGTAAISTAMAPGTYTPEETLFSFAGEDSTGTWTIDVTDIYPLAEYTTSTTGVDGSFMSWDLAFDESTFSDGM